LLAESTAAARRYRRYTVEADPARFQFPDSGGTPIYFWDPLGKEAGSPARIHHWMNNFPDITIWQGAIEAPDEPCTGPALATLCKRGLNWTLAVTDHLRAAPGVISRIVERDGAATRLAISRARPGVADDDGLAAFDEGLAWLADIGVKT
jgi:hypothetical protein